MKRGQKNPRNDKYFIEVINILPTQLYSLSFSVNILSKEKQSSLIAAFENL